MIPRTQQDPIAPFHEATEPRWPEESRPWPLMATAVLRRRRWILAAALGAAALVAAFVLTRQARYVSVSSFVVRSGGSRSQLAGIAAQLGISAPSGDATSSPEFFGALATASSILAALSADSVATRGGRTGVTAALDITNGDTLLRRELVIRRLRLMIDPSVQPRIGLVRLSISAPDPLLARGLNERLLFHVERFYRESRQTQASAERSFAENQLQEAGAELRTAEDRLRGFEESNRNYAMSPQLRIAHDRLLRDIAMRQQVYTTVLQARETARLDEARSVPVINVVDSPSLPVQPSSRMLLLKVLGAFLIILVVGSLAAIARQSSPFRDARPEALDELRSLTRETLAELRSPWRIFRSNKAES